MTVKETVPRWSDPVRCERIIARIVECLLEAKLAEVKEAWRSRVGMARILSRQLRSLTSAVFNVNVMKSKIITADHELLGFFNSIAVKPVTKKFTSIWPESCAELERTWEQALYKLKFRKRDNKEKFDLLEVGGPVSRNAFIKMSENAGVYDHLTQLPEVAPKPRKAKRTLMQSRADKATEAARLWRRRLRLAKAKLEKYTKQQKYYAKKEVKE